MKLLDYSDMAYHPTSEKIVNVLRNQTQNTRSDSYFRVVTSFYLAQMASSMRTSVNTPDRGVIPVNLYACCTMASGAGKGHSQAILEDSIIKDFQTRFTEETFPEIAQKALEAEAVRKCTINGSDYEVELEALQKEFDSYGAMPFVFSEGTAPAYKQIRTKAQMAKIGALNYVIDEVGSNLTSGEELWTVCLETYDIGRVKDKITKASSENKRHAQRTDAVPSNMLAFGTPAKLFDGGKTETEYNGKLETGYGRRFLFGNGDKGTDVEITAEELFDILTKNTSSQDVSDLRVFFGRLADVSNYHRSIDLKRDEAIMLLQYKLDCEKLADQMGSYNHVHKAQMQHRYFNVLKLAGAYAFIDSTANITADQLYAAIKVVEDSGTAFNEIMSRPKNYARLAQYISEVEEEVTHADIIEKLVFYPSSKGAREELLSLATAWGYKNNIIIKRSISNGIEFMKGESLRETSLDNLVVSYGTHEAYGYTNRELKFKQLQELCQASGHHWVNHFLENGHRSDETTLMGCNVIVLDVDGETSVDTARLLLQEYTHYIYTTKRHTPEENRFRVILPMKYHLKLSKADYKEFMNNVLQFFPFGSDDCANQRSKKWLANKGIGYSHEANLFDPLPFIPKTQKNIDRVADTKALGDMGKIERFFANQWHTGRNNTLLKFGTMIMDSGVDLYEAQKQVTEFNNKFPDPISTEELNNTVFKTLSKKSL